MSYTPITARKYCSQCGAPVVIKCPDGDTCERSVCESCGYIAYDNPKVLVACFATHEDKLLWMRRKCEPGAGYWFIPTGFMELGESPEEAASRELVEETCAVVNPQNLDFYVIGSLPEISQIYLAYRGEIEDISTIQTTCESLEVELFTQDQVPWDKLAFPGVIETFQIFYKEHAKNNYGAYRAQVANNTHIITAINNVTITVSANPKS